MALSGISTASPGFRARRLLSAAATCNGLLLISAYTPNNAWAQPPQPLPALSALRASAFRLSPGADLKLGISAAVRKQQASAATVISCVGSLQRAHLRFAGKQEGAWVEGPLEIVSLVGTLGPDGEHLHLAVSDALGKTTGGHLLSGSTVFTTAEVVLGLLPDARFQRLLDPKTGFRELTISPRLGAPTEGQ
jgi:predicted DNA-binding protein with PD1-like motif